MTGPTGGQQPPYRDEPQSTQEAVKQEATDVARTAAGRGAQVGDTAGEQARRVASETARQARDLMREGRGQLAEQAKEGQRKAASSLHTLADQLRNMADKTDGEGLASEVVHQAAERTRGLATWLDEREPGALLDEVRAFARRRPGTFLAGAALAGVLVGRLTRSAVAGTDQNDQPSGSADREPPTRPAATPQPLGAPPPAGVLQPGDTSQSGGASQSAGTSQSGGTPQSGGASQTGGSPQTAATPQPVGTPPAPAYSVPPPPPPASDTRTGTPDEYPGPVTR